MKSNISYQQGGLTYQMGRLAVLMAINNLKYSWQFILENEVDNNGGNIKSGYKRSSKRKEMEVNFLKEK